jgi:hypothetical protein
MRRWSSPSEADNDDASAQNRRGEGVPGGQQWRATCRRRVHVVWVLGDGVRMGEKRDGIGNPRPLKRGVVGRLTEKKWKGGWGWPNDVHTAWRGRGPDQSRASRCDISMGTAGAGGGRRRHASHGNRGKGVRYGRSRTGCHGPGPNT